MVKKHGLGFRVLGLGFRVWVLGFGVEGLDSYLGEMPVEVPSGFDGNLEGLGFRVKGLISLRD